MKATTKLLSEVVQFSEEIARQAGEKLLNNQKKLSSLKISVKEAQGVVSNADVEAEDHIIKAIRKRFPETEILAEESSYEEFESTEEAVHNFLRTEWLWIIDPLDGTTNYLNNMDYYAVCISLAHFGEPVTGVVYRPRTGECFSASKGQGAFKHNLQESDRRHKLFMAENCKDLRGSLLVTGFATEKGEVFDREFELFKHMMGKSRGIRRMGSAALDMCLVAEGIFDAFWERGLAPWDMAASGIICQESGVRVSDYAGQAFSPFQETILAAREHLYSEISKHFT